MALEARTPLSSWAATASTCILILSIPLGGAMPAAAAASSSLLGVAAILLARIRDTEPWRQVVLWPLIAILAVWSISCLGSALPAAAIRRSATMPLYGLLLPTVQVACWSPTTRRVVSAASLLAILGLSLDVVVARIWESALFSEDRGMAGDRVVGSQGNSNDFAAAAILMPFAMLVLPDRVSQWMRAPIAAVPIPCWALTLSRQALLGWTAALLVVIGLESGPRHRRVAMVSLMLTAVLAALLVPAVRDRLASTFQGELGNRPVLYAFAGSLVPEAPWTGIGPGVFGEYYVDGVSEGWNWKGRPLRAYGVPWVHSIPLEVLVELGLLGLATFGIVTADVGRAVRRGLHQGSRDRRLAIAVTAAAAALLSMGLVDLSFLKDWFRCLFWLILGFGYASAAEFRRSTARKLEEHG